ncbi:septum formation initiator family protein [Sphingomonas sp. SUN039]|uniref:FtsB family cell division protein n=1 Tax=Sphingomonas sp. SUN039 TaxID=2937787 RepID=UPI002164C208|nr:septum formation initiator family protein [Sphingomonas sp. SUN039]UVO53216.1 septum formation initiator family protein [Sphingomonas sp. SUN039]
MAKSKTFWINLRAAAAPAAALIVVAFFGGYALLGPNGALAWGDYSRQLKERNAQLDRVEKARGELANRVALLDGRHADRDLADELVRRDLGLVEPGERVIRWK